MITEAMNDAPNDFIGIYPDKVRSSKNSDNRYSDIDLKKQGKKMRLNISWAGVALTGGIKPLEERKYDPTIQFRRSSGVFGEAVYQTYEELERLIESGIADKSIKVKKGKDIFRSIVQKDIDGEGALDDPIIRFKLPFKNGKPDFQVVRIDEINGKPKSVVVKCTAADIHTIIRSRMITSGYATMDTLVFSGFGISVPAKVQLLVIKPLESDSPEVEDVLTEEQMLAMMGPPPDDDEVKCKSNAPGDAPVDDSDVDADADASAAMVEQLRALSAEGNNNDDDDGDAPDIE